MLGSNITKHNKYFFSFSELKRRLKAQKKAEEKAEKDAAAAAAAQQTAKEEKVKVDEGEIDPNVSLYIVLMLGL